MEYCQTIIYVHSVRVQIGLNQGGNKAFAYAAEAAGYDYMIAYNPKPCVGVYRTDVIEEQSGDIFHGTSCCGHREHHRAEVFRVKDLLLYINRYEPPRKNPLFPLDSPFAAIKPKYNVMQEFTLHFGPHWYFCSSTRH